jgi:hypothetical protein
MGLRVSGAVAPSAPDHSGLSRIDAQPAINSYG